MVIEWLKVRVLPELRERYIQKDEEIWTAALSQFPGFLGKQVWINPKEPSEIVMVIFWDSKAAWQAVPDNALEQIGKRFDLEIGKDNYELIEEGEYQVRKFPQDELQPRSR